MAVEGQRRDAITIRNSHSMLSYCGRGCKEQDHNQYDESTNVRSIRSKYVACLVMHPRSIRGMNALRAQVK